MKRTFWITSLLTATLATAPAFAQMPAKAQACAGCHGPDGNSASPVFPKLAGQHAQYLENALKAYRDGLRRNDMMNNFAKGLSDEDIKALAAYYASQTCK